MVNYVEDIASSNRDILKVRLAGRKASGPPDRNLEKLLQFGPEVNKLPPEDAELMLCFFY